MAEIIQVREKPDSHLPLYSPSGDFRSKRQSLLSGSQWPRQAGASCGAALILCLLLQCWLLRPSQVPHSSPSWALAQALPRTCQAVTRLLSALPKPAPASLPEAGCPRPSVSFYLQSCCGQAQPSSKWGTQAWLPP